ncbi:four-helix bundle copper-binding protein [Pontibacter cellulosilyticus]|uniref:Four-helix bundle copper-binding protein n=1 Tax=Pontibacter cellulosilyticus TaxID=1720253 RepID=A0A923N2T6_9BACT|nr:four-helix bundle copper-binding protein [Pontibacter cellulosilyticus]MBC5991845.1 four-helix bundle copper-binding protein [Pontibacter cellulosilyticus]
MKSERTNELEHVLIKCITACETCATACLHEDNVKMMARCIMIDRDCADICTLTARFMARDSEHTKHVMKECIEICRQCEAECRKHDHDHCQKCADACRECAEACEAWMKR